MSPCPRLHSTCPSFHTLQGATACFREPAHLQKCSSHPASFQKSEKGRDVNSSRGQPWTSHPVRTPKCEEEGRSPPLTPRFSPPAAEPGAGQGRADRGSRGHVRPGPGLPASPEAERPAGCGSREGAAGGGFTPSSGRGLRSPSTRGSSGCSPRRRPEPDCPRPGRAWRAGPGGAAGRQGRRRGAGRGAAGAGGGGARAARAGGGARRRRRRRASAPGRARGGGRTDGRSGRGARGAPAEPARGLRRPAGRRGSCSAAASARLAAPRGSGSGSGSHRPGEGQRRRRRRRGRRRRRRKPGKGAALARSGRRPAPARPGPQRPLQRWGTVARCRPRSDRATRQAVWSSAGPPAGHRPGAYVLLGRPFQRSRIVQPPRVHPPRPPILALV